MGEPSIRNSIYGITEIHHMYRRCKLRPIHSERHQKLLNELDRHKVDSLTDQRRDTGKGGAFHRPSFVRKPDTQDYPPDVLSRLL
jgi:hypothetical protein